MTSQLEAYSELIKLRDILKKVQQVSWNFNQFERRFPMEQLQENDFIPIRDAYLGFMNDILSISREIEMKIYEKPTDKLPAA